MTKTTQTHKASAQPENVRTCLNGRTGKSDHIRKAIAAQAPEPAQHSPLPWEHNATKPFIIVEAARKAVAEYEGSKP
jgi:hypothetical protein